MALPYPTPYKWVIVREYIDINNATDGVAAIESELDPETGKIRYYIDWAECRHIETGVPRSRKLARDLGENKSKKYKPELSPITYRK